MKFNRFLGFGGMEIETAFRYNLPITFIIMNNNGIYAGLDSTTFEEIQKDTHPCLAIPPTSLLPNIKYDKLSLAFEGFQGFSAKTPDGIFYYLESTFLLIKYFNKKIKFRIRKCIESQFKC